MKTAEFTEAAQSIQELHRTYRLGMKAQFLKLANLEVKVLRDELSTLLASSIAFVAQGFLIQSLNNHSSSHVGYTLSKVILDDLRFTAVLSPSFDPATILLRHFPGSKPTDNEMADAFQLLSLGVVDRATSAAFNLLSSPF